MSIRKPQFALSLLAAPVDHSGFAGLPLLTGAGIGSRALAVVVSG